MEAQRPDTAALAARGAKNWTSKWNNDSPIASGNVGEAKRPAAVADSPTPPASVSEAKRPAVVAKDADSPNKSSITETKQVLHISKQFERVEHLDIKPMLHPAADESEELKNQDVDSNVTDALEKLKLRISATDHELPLPVLLLVCDEVASKPTKLTQLALRLCGTALGICARRSDVLVVDGSAQAQLSDIILKQALQSGEDSCSSPSPINVVQLFSDYSATTRPDPIAGISGRSSANLVCAQLGKEAREKLLQANAGHGVDRREAKALAHFCKELINTVTKRPSTIGTGCLSRCGVVAVVCGTYSKSSLVDQMLHLCASQRFPIVAVSNFTSFAKGKGGQRASVSTPVYQLNARACTHEQLASLLHAMLIAPSSC